MITPCPEGSPLPLNIGRRGKLVYYAWNSQTKKFDQHCNFNDEKDVKRDYIYDNSYFRHNLAKMQRAVTVAQAYQDVTVYEMFSSEPEPFYVDLAANHWILISNTFMLDAHRKWKGICIEPTPIYLSGLVVNRTCHVVKNVVSSTDNAVVEYVHHGTYGGILGENSESGLDNYKGRKKSQNWETEKTLAVSLTTILAAFNAPSVIEYLSLDVSIASTFYL